MKSQESKLAELRNGYIGGRSPSQCRKKIAAQFSRANEMEEASNLQESCVNESFFPSALVAGLRKGVSPKLPLPRESRLRNPFNSMPGYREQASRLRLVRPGRKIKA